jgi:hypothetical protein
MLNQTVTNKIIPTEMEMYLHGELVYDDRNSEELYGKNLPWQPSYSDVMKRWSIGDHISQEEQRIVTNLLILDPEYILNNGKSIEFIESIRQSLQSSELQNPDNPEKGLFLYTLFFFLIKTGAGKEAMQVLHELENVFAHYNNSCIPTVNNHNGPLFARDLIDRHLEIWKKPDPVRLAYFEIISRVMDSNELLCLEPDLNLNRLPLPQISLWEEECIEIRSKAFSNYQIKEYKEATILYRRLRIERFELPGTLTHMARVELCTGNFSQAKTHTEMAWRHRAEAPPYVFARILWFKLCLLMLKPEDKEDYSGIISLLKKTLQNQDAYMGWTMEPVLEQLKPKLQKNDHKYLSELVDEMSNKKNITKLDAIPFWKQLNFKT